ncbi:MAG: Ppx/GppA family phosphatase [Pseudomonadota bacterium]
MDGTSETTPDWGPFGRPLFDDPSVRALSRVGVVDVGSNSVRLVVFDGAARSPAYFYNEKIMCGLGAGFGETGHLSPEGRARALAALRRFATLADSMGIAPLTAVATAAVRDASDGPDFQDQVLRETGVKLWVIDGLEEARLSAQGVLLGWPGAYGLVCDIGGSSMELAEIAGGRVGRRVTSELGPFKLMDIKGGRKGRKAHIKETLDRITAEIGPQRDRLFLVGGSWRAIAKIDMIRRGYPLKVLHEYRMSRDAVRKTCAMIAKADLEALRVEAGVSASRMALVPFAADVLARLVRHVGPKDIAVSSYGIREGLLYEQMPDRLRERDPLIEAARFAEAKDARLPGFGRKLYTFLQPLFRNLPDHRLRLVKAACLLHDVSWRAHPDYRAEICFDNATRANLGGLKHAERVFLGLALMYRYSSKHDGTRIAPLLGMLTDRDLRDAEVLGRAMRVGAMLWTAEGDSGQLRWRPKRRVLELHLTDAAAPLYGEVAAARMTALAGALQAELQVTIGGKQVS